MKRNKTQIQPQKTIKMVAWNPCNRAWEEIFPEDEFSVSEMVPMFWSPEMEKYVSVPDCPASIVYGTWARQF